MRWIFLRGLVREQRHWGEFRRKFAEERALCDEQILGLDFPGIGTEKNRAFPPSLLALLDDLRRRAAIAPGEKVGVFSMSLGSMVALQWASMYPQELAGAVLVNTSASNISKLTDRASVFALQSFAKIVASENAFDREKLILALTSNLHSDRGDLAESWASFAPSKNEFLRMAMKQLWVAARFRAPEKIDVPLLILSSSSDRLVSAKCSAVLAKKYDCTNHVHLKAGHDLVLDDPDWVIRQTLDWLGHLPS